MKFVRNNRINDSSTTVGKHDLHCSSGGQGGGRHGRGRGGEGQGGGEGYGRDRGGIAEGYWRGRAGGQGEGRSRVGGGESLWSNGFNSNTTIENVF